MANQKYAQVPAMAGSGQLNWRSDHIVAMLMQNVTFVSTHTHYSDIPVKSQKASAEIPSRSMGEGGEAMGLPAVFQRVAKALPYQVLVVKDVGDADPMLLAFYNEDTDGGLLQMANNGTLIVRPTAIPNASPASLGVWFTI